MNLSKIRHYATTLLLKACCRLTAGRTLGDELHRTRILSGPLRGLTFCMPKLERVSFALGTYEPHVVRCMTAHVRAGTTAYDIGGNAGYLTMVLSTLVGQGGNVVAFEPDPKNVAALRHNISDNSIDNVMLVQRAVSDQSHECTFAIFDYSLVSHIATDYTPDDAQLITVSASRLDDLVYDEDVPAPQFIKIDVEGAEDRVIRGSLRLIEEHRPVILAEIRAGPVHDEIARLLKDLGYVEKPLAGGPSLDRDHFSDVLFVPN
jgi:FkbM family methyltransferase